MSIIEAVCTRCGEVFNPLTVRERDLVHILREDGSSCGGTGEVRGVWLQ